MGFTKRITVGSTQGVQTVVLPDGRLEKGTGVEENQHDLFSEFLSGLEEVRELPVDFSGKLFQRLVDYATVHSGDGMVVVFRGIEIRTGT